MTVREIAELADQLADYNDAYRSGHPLISDPDYDALVERLRALAPDHPYLKQIEPEQFPAKRRIRHPEPMLSIQKAYTRRQVALFVARVDKVAVQLANEAAQFRVTAKLDGVAGRDDGRLLVTRGDGRYGFDITRAFDVGVVPVGGRGNGLGEIVISKSYFNAHLAETFEHPRNLVVGILGSDTVNPLAQAALDAGAVQFVAYNQLRAWTGGGGALVDQIETIYRDIVENIDYPVDGVVAQVDDAVIQVRMGATANHYRWQIAYKKRGEIGTTTVKAITWQVGRTGNVTPVLEVMPIRLSGATIRRVTAHHAGMARKMKVGPGARIELIRSGEVIPKLEQVISTGEEVDIPEQCPSCGSALVWRGDFLRCPNRATCRDQIAGGLHHWFKTLRNADWFGLKTIVRLVDGGIDSLARLYATTVDTYEALGFGPVQSRNLYEAIQLSRTQPVEDWRFLAALGISGLGVGESRKLLLFCPLESLWDLGWKQVAEIKGFGEIKSRTIMGGLGECFDSYCDMLSLGFNLIRTAPSRAEQEAQTPVSGKKIVFTGKMTAGSRSDMQALARNLGATVQTSVSGVTDLLVCGRNVGSKKMEKARSKGVRVMTEKEFMRLIDEKK